MAGISNKCENPRFKAECLNNGVGTKDHKTVIPFISIIISLANFSNKFYWSAQSVPSLAWHKEVSVVECVHATTK